jgi:RNA polymerase sigma-70 factor, ECF subfamily
VVARFPDELAQARDHAGRLDDPEPAVRVAGSSAPRAARSLPPSFAALYKEYFSFVWRTMAALGVAQAGLDDAVQDAFLVVHRRLGEFEGRASAKTWLFSIAHRVALNHRRRERRKGGLAALPRELPSHAPNPLESAEHRQSWRFVERFLDGLDDDRRAVFVLCVLEGASAPEASEALGVKVNTIYSRLHAVRAAFREALAREPEDPSHA